jgi:hypothetical protein
MTGSDVPREACGLEVDLRELRPEPAFEFMRSLERSLVVPAPVARRSAPRVALATGVTLVLTAALAATGSLSYAASSVQSATRIVARAAAPHTALVARGLTAGGDQYRAGYGFGDENHNHTGPPGLQREDAKGGALAPPLQASATSDRFGSTISTAVNFDEQAHLYISVIDAGDSPLLLTQRSKRGGSKIGEAVSGPQTKFIQYAVLVPRPIPMTLRIPANLLASGQIYRLRIVAIDPDGNKSSLLIPFRA